MNMRARIWLLGTSGAAVAAALALAADTDLDTMDDAFEDFFGLSKTNAVDAALNYDTDSLTNAQEAVLWTDPFEGDTDQDGWKDDADSNALSRAVIMWGNPKFTSGDDFLYTGPAWWKGAFKSGGTWLNGSWEVAAGETNPASLNIILDRAILTNAVRMDITLMDRAGAGLETDLLDTNGVEVATNLFGNLIAETGVEVMRKVSVDLPANPLGSSIRLRRSAGAVTVYETLLYVDIEGDGLDEDQEAQLGTSDLLGDTDGDGASDRFESQVGTDPVNAASLPGGPVLLTAPGNAAVACGSATDPAQTGQATALSDCATAAAVSYADATTELGSGRQLAWRLDEPAGGVLAADATGHGRHGSYSYRAESGAAGQIGGAANFAGWDYMTGPAVDFTSGGSYSVSVWINVQASASGAAAVFGALNAATLGYGVYLELNHSTHTVRFLHRWPLGASGGTSIFANQVTDDGQWHQLTAVKDGSLMQLYIDGVPRGSATNATTINAALDLRLGRMSLEGNDRLFVGRMDDLAVWNRALSATEVAKLQQAGRGRVSAADASGYAAIRRQWQAADACGHATQAVQTITVDDTTPPDIACPSNVTQSCVASLDPAATGTPAVWDVCAGTLPATYVDALSGSVPSLHLQLKLDEFSGTVATDASDFGHDGTYGWSPALGQAGVAGAACQLDGVNDVVLVPGPVAFATNGAYTVSSWFKSGSSAAQALFAATSNHLHGVLLELSSGRMRFLHRWPAGSSGGTSLYSPTGTNWANGQWHHVAAIKNGNIMSLYMDGALKGTATNTSTISTGLNLAIGRLADNNAIRQFNGSLDDISAWSRAFTSNEVATLYQNGLAGRSALASANPNLTVTRTWSATDLLGLSDSCVQTLTLTGGHADTDGDDLADYEERLSGSDPTQTDSDGDGLADGAEIAHGTNLLLVDSDGDSLGDGYEVAHGLNPRLNDAANDADGDGLSNLEEHLLGLDPQADDTVTDVVTVNGATATTNRVGRWAVNGGDLFAVDRRGYVEYALEAPAADLYRVQIEGTQNIPGSPAAAFALNVSVDNERLGRITLGSAGYGTTGAARVFAPYLTAGSHTVRVYWDNADGYTSLRIQRVKLQSLGGADSDTNGIKDWVEALLAGTCTVETPAASYVSPACLEGRGRYPSLLSLSNAVSGAVLQAQPAPQDRWFADVPLDYSNREAVVSVSFQHGGRVVDQTVTWVARNVLEGGALTIRQGDTLLLTAAPADATNGTVTIAIGAAQYATTPEAPVAHLFATTGVFTVAGIYTDGGDPLEGTLAVTVAAHCFAAGPHAWVDLSRTWDVPGVFAEVALDADTRLHSVVTVAETNGTQTLTLQTARQDPLYIASRAGAGGAILDVAAVYGFRYWSSTQGYLRRVAVYPDGSDLVEMLMVLSPVPARLEVQVDILSGGVTFADGTTLKTYTAADFDGLGQCRVQFLRGAGQGSTICHRVKLIEDQIWIGGY